MFKKKSDSDVEKASKSPDDHSSLSISAQKKGGVMSFLSSKKAALKGSSEEDLDMEKVISKLQPLSKAVACNEETKVKEILSAKKKIEINLQDKTTNRTALHWVSTTGNISIAQLLLGYDGKDGHIDTNIIDYEGKTALHLAVLGRFSDLVQIYTELKAPPVNIPDANGFTPLVYAVKNNDVECCSLLIQKGSKMDIKNEKLIFFALKNDYHDVALSLISFGADVNVSDVSNKTPLYYAVAFQNLELVKLLISKNAQCDNTVKTLAEQHAQKSGSNNAQNWNLDDQKNASGAILDLVKRATLKIELQKNVQKSMNDYSGGLQVKELASPAVSDVSEVASIQLEEPIDDFILPSPRAKQGKKKDEDEVSITEEQWLALGLPKEEYHQRKATDSNGDLMSKDSLEDEDWDLPDLGISNINDTKSRSKNSVNTSSSKLAKSKDEAPLKTTNHPTLIVNVEDFTPPVPPIRSPARLAPISVDTNVVSVNPLFSINKPSPTRRSAPQNFIDDKNLKSNSSSNGDMGEKTLIQSQLDVAEKTLIQSHTNLPNDDEMDQTFITICRLLNARNSKYNITEMKLTNTTLKTLYSKIETVLEDFSMLERKHDDQQILDKKEKDASKKELEIANQKLDALKKELDEKTSQNKVLTEKNLKIVEFSSSNQQQIKILENEKEELKISLAEKELEKVSLTKDLRAVETNSNNLKKEYSTLLSKINDREAIEASLQEKISQLELQNSKLKDNQKNSLEMTQNIEKIKAENDIALQNSKKQLDILVDQNKKLAEEVDQKGKSIKKLESEQQAAAVEFDNLLKDFENKYHNLEETNALLKTQIVKLEQEYKSVTAESDKSNQNSKRDLDSLLNQNKKLTEEVSLKEKSIKKLESEQQAAAIEFDNLLKDFETKYHNLEETNDSLKAQIVKLEQEYKSVTVESDKSNQNSKRDLDSLLDQNKKLADEVIQKCASIKKLESEQQAAAMEFENRLKDFEAQRQKLQETNVSLQTQFEKLEQEHLSATSESNKSIQEADEKYKNVEKYCHQLLQTISSLQADLQTSNSKNESLESTIKSNNATSMLVLELENQVANLKSNIFENESHIVNLESTSKNKLLEKETIIRSESEMRKKAEENVSRLEQELENLHQNLELLRSSSTQSDDLTKNMIKLQDEHKHLERQMKEKDQQISKLEFEIQKLEKDQEEKTAEFESFLQESAQLRIKAEGERTQFEANAKLMLKDINSNAANFQQAKNERDHFEQQLQITEVELHEIKKTVEGLNAEIANLNNAKSILTKQNESLTSKIAELEIQKNNSDSELQSKSNILKDEKLQLEAELAKERLQANNLKNGYQTQIDILNKEISVLNDTILQLKESINDLMNNNKSINKQLEFVETERERSVSELKITAERATKFKIIEDELTTCKDDNRRMMLELQDLKHKNALYIDEKKKYQESQLASQMKCDQVEKLLAESQKRIDFLQKESSKFVQNGLEHNTNSPDTVSKLKIEVDVLKKSLETTKKQLAEEREEKSKLQTGSKQLKVSPSKTSTSTVSSDSLHLSKILALEAKHRVSVSDYEQKLRVYEEEMTKLSSRSNSLLPNPDDIPKVKILQADSPDHHMLIEDLNQRLQEQLTALKQENKKLNDELLMLSNSTVNGSSPKQKIRIHQKILDLEEEVKKLKNLEAERIAKIRTLEQIIHARDKSIELLESDIKKEALNIQNLEESNKTLQKELSDTRQEADQAMQHFRDEITVMQNASASDGYDNKLAHLETELQSRNETIKTLENNLAKLVEKEHLWISKIHSPKPVHEENSEVEIEVPPEVEVDGQKTKNSNVDQNVVKLDVSDELQERERLLQLEHERIENLNESLMAVKEQLATSRETNKQIISDLEREKLERSKLQNQLELLKNSNQTYSRERSSILAQDTENTRMQANSEISNLKKKLQEETTKNIQISKELRSLMAKEPTNQGNEYLVLLQDQLEEERKIRINLEQDYAISYKSVIEMESDIAAVRKLLDEEIKSSSEARNAKTKLENELIESRNSMLKFKQQLEKTVLLSQISVSQNKDLEDALEASKESLKQSQIREKEQNNLIDSLREEIIKGENILSDYSDKANEASQKYLETIREKQSQLEELTLSYNDLKNRLETTTSLLNTAESKNEKLDLQAKQITEMNYLLDDMKLRLNDNAEFSKREAANVADLIQKNKNLNAQLNDSKNLNDSQQKEISTLSSRISALNNVEIELTNAKRIIEDSKQAAIQFEKTISSHNGTIVELQKRNEAFGLEINSLKSEIVKLNQIVEQEANAKKKNHDQIESSIAEIEKKIKTLQDNARIVDEEFSFVDNDVSLETLVENLDNVWSKSEHTLTYFKRQGEIWIELLHSLNLNTSTGVQLSRILSLLSSYYESVTYRKASTLQSSCSRSFNKICSKITTHMKNELLSRDVKGLESIREKEGMIKNLETKNVNLENQINDFKRSMNELSGKHHALQVQSSNLQRKFNEDNQKLKQGIQELQTNLNEKTNIISSLEARSALADQLEKIKSEQITKIKLIETQLSKTTSLLKAAQLDNNFLRHELTERDPDFVEKLDSITEIKPSISLRTDSTVEASILAEKRLQSSKNETLTTLDLGYDMDSESNGLDQALNKRKLTFQSMKEYKEKVSLNTQIEASKKQILQLQSELEKEKLSHEQDKQKLEAQIRQDKESVTKLEMMLKETTLSNEQNTIRSKMSMQEVLRAASERVEKLSKERVTMENTRIENEQIMQQGYEKQIRLLLDDIGRLRQKLDKSAKKINQLENEIVDLKQKLKDAQAVAERSQRIAGSIGKQVAEVTALVRHNSQLRLK